MATVTTEIRKTTVDELRREADALMRAHWREVAEGLRDFDPYWTRYALLENHGSLILLAAWSGDVMVGYSVGIVGAHSQDRTRVQMHCEALFVREDFRRQGLGTGLLAATELAAREIGQANEIAVSAPVGSRMERFLHGRKDYGHRETVFVKEFA